MGEEIFNAALQRGKAALQQMAKKLAKSLLANPYTYIVLAILIIIIIICGIAMDDSNSDTETDYGYTNVGDSDFSGQKLVKIAQGLHDFIRNNNYAYSCVDNVNNNYSNECECNGASHFGKNNFDAFDDIKCIDCSAYVSWVLNQYLGDELFSTRWWSGNFGDESYWPAGWEKININDIQAGDILWKSGHVGIYIGDGKTVEAGSTRAIRSEYSYGNLQTVKSNYTFAIRINK